MPCIAGLYDPSIGLLIQVSIFGVGKFPVSDGQNVPWPCYAALVDTGASCTCVSKKVITDCGLLSHSKITMISASGNVEANAFMFHVGIPLALPGVTVGPSGHVSAQVHTFQTPIQGMELLNSPGRFEILLGMDILSNCSLKIEFDRHYSLCW
jgi:predicted aspartyl protease